MRFEAEVISLFESFQSVPPSNFRHGRRENSVREGLEGTHLRICNNTVSSVYDLCHALSMPNLVGSTLPFTGDTKGRLMRDMKVTRGGASGYESPQVMRRE